MLDILSLSKNFSDKKVLNNLNIKIEEGSVFGLIGINGAGKSTLLRIIAGVIKADTGEVKLNGEDTFLNPEVRKDIIFVSDDLYFPVSSNIKSLKDYYSSFYDLDESLYQEYLKMFNLDENKLISSFSKGMKRQTVLLFAMAIKPKLLLLDECFDGLDPLMRHNFKKALISLIEDKEITVIISSHNLKELEDICDSFGILKNGSIDTYGDLLKSKENINKYQLAYDFNKSEDDFKEFEIMDFMSSGRVINMTIKGNRDEVISKLKDTNPLLIDVLPVNFEELFIYESEDR